MGSAMRPRRGQGLRVPAQVITEEQMARARARRERARAARARCQRAADREALEAQARVGSAAVGEGTSTARGRGAGLSGDQQLIADMAAECAGITWPPPPELWRGSKGAVQTRQVALAIHHYFPAAIRREGDGCELLFYRDGVYSRDPALLTAMLTELLGNDYSRMVPGKVTDHLVGLCLRTGRVVREFGADGLINVRNGMLHPLTGVLVAHSPGYLSAVQLPVSWDVGARCPTYESWLAAQVGDPGEGGAGSLLEEVLSTVLFTSDVASKVEKKVLFLYGDPRTGKGTAQRLAAAIAGEQNTTPLTLHDITENRFKASMLVGGLLNVGGDLSSRYVADASLFKMLTGRDRISCERKGQGAFSFLYSGTFIFAANDLPTVSEGTNAYVDRMFPWKFVRGFEGREDPGIEARMLAELDGIFLRWCRALWRVHERGGYPPVEAIEGGAAALAEFRESSDPVASWVADHCHVHPVPGNGGPDTVMPARAASGIRDLVRAYNNCIRELGGRVGRGFGEREFARRLAKIPGVARVRNDVGGRGWNVQVIDGMPAGVAGVEQQDARVVPIDRGRRG